MLHQKQKVKPFLMNLMLFQSLAVPDPETRDEPDSFPILDLFEKADAQFDTLASPGAKAYT